MHYDIDPDNWPLNDDGELDPDNLPFTDQDGNTLDSDPDNWPYWL